MLVILVVAKAEVQLLALALFKHNVLITATAAGLALGIGMFSAIAFVPRVLQRPSGTSTASSALSPCPLRHREATILMNCKVGRKQTSSFGSPGCKLAYSPNCQ